jgi:hypothetical protein
MTMPGFTAEESIRSQRSSYRRGVQMMEENVVVPSLPSAEQCQWAADNCVDPKSPACRLLSHCGGAVGRGPTPPHLFGWPAFNDYLLCVVGCQFEQGCVNVFC